MKTLLALASSVLLCNALLAQGFIKKHTLNPKINAQSYGVNKTSYGYLINGINVDTVTANNGYWAYTVLGVDSLGNQLFKKSYGDSSYNYGGYSFSIKKTDQKYIGIGIKVFNAIGISTIVNFNEQGDTLWTKEYFGDAVDTTLLIYKIIKTTGNNFYLTGETFNLYDSNSKGILIKIDTLGNIIWKKKYDISTGVEQAGTIVEDSITKKILLFYFLNYTVQSKFLTLDSLGNLLSIKNINSNNVTSIVEPKRTNDGNFIAVGSIDSNKKLGNLDLRKACVVKLTPQGNVLWTKSYGAEGGVNGFTDVELLAGDTIVACGNIDTTYIKLQGHNDMFMLYKIAPNGDSLWSGYYDFNPINSGAQDICTSMCLAPDGGYALTGFTTGTAPNPFILVKVDKQGCVQAGCNTTATQELNINKTLTLYPNPTTHTLNVYTPQATQLFIYNLLGSVIQSTYTTTETTTINTSNLINGIYIIKTNTGQVGKFVKE